MKLVMVEMYFQVVLQSSVIVQVMLSLLIILFIIIDTLEYQWDGNGVMIHLEQVMS
jgi:hypothetical protein